MAFSRMAFEPETGLRDTDEFPSTPASEDEAREQIQGRLDEIRDYINEELIAELQNAETGTSGAERIGSAAIQNVEGTSVRAQIADLKEQIDSISAGSVADGTITEAKLADDAVTVDKLASDAVTTLKIADGAVTAAKLAEGALDGANLVAASVSAEKIAGYAIGPGKIADYAVTEMKISGGAVTVTKIGAGAVSADKILNGAVTADKISNSAVTADKILNSAVTESKIGPSAVTTAKLGIVQSISLDSSNTITYNTTSKKLMLNISGCTAVQLAPILYGSGEPEAGTYPAGTIYIQHE